MAVDVGTQTSEQNKQTVLALCKAAFGDKRRAAAAEFLGSTYIQHNPKFESGPEPFLGLVDWLATNAPDMTQEIKRVVADGDIVMTHSVVKLAPEERGVATVDIFRLEDGKVVEHWDVAQRVPESTVSGHPMV